MADGDTMNFRSPEGPGRGPTAGSMSFFKGIGGVYLAVGGFVVGIVGVFGSLFASPLTLAAVIVNLLGVIWLGTLGYFWLRRGRPRLTRKNKAHVSLSVLVALVLMVTATGVTFFSSEIFGEEPGQEEACVYDVKTKDTTVPIVSGGSITQGFTASASRIHAISVIIGLDAAIANLDRRHPVALRVTSPEERVDQTLEADDITNNGFTRFNLPEPLSIKNQNSVFTMQIINKSSEPIGVNIKIPDESDFFDSPREGVFILGHLGQEDPYRKPDYALSGCVAGRR